MSKKFRAPPWNIDWVNIKIIFIVSSMEESLFIFIVSLIKITDIVTSFPEISKKISCLSFTIEFDVANGKYLKTIKKIASFFSVGMRSRVFLPSTLLTLLYFIPSSVIFYISLSSYHSSQLSSVFLDFVCTIEKWGNKQSKNLYANNFILLLCNFSFVQSDRPWWWRRKVICYF